MTKALIVLLARPNSRSLGIVPRGSAALSVRRLTAPLTIKEIGESDSMLISDEPRRGMAIGPICPR
jgi:hypothetical protein